ncbi:MAG: tetratricopeptide repeat protein [Nitrososphaeraceae archaeon]|nr:tetratricopeptide repeat protein [Nitrososphaeraceae archaeon]
MGNDNENDPQYWINMGYSLTSEGKSEQAIKYYKKALELDPESHVALTNLGIAQSKTGDWENAKKNLIQATELYPNMVEVWINLSTVYNHEGDQEQEMNCYDRALELDSSRLKFGTTEDIFTDRKGCSKMPY